MSFDQLTQLTEEQQAEFVKEIEAAKDKFSTKELDVIYRRYIKDIMQTERLTDNTGRILIHCSYDPISWIVGILSLGTSLSLSSEIGHGIVHNAFNSVETINRKAYLNHEKRQLNAIIRPWGWHDEHNVKHHVRSNIYGSDLDLGFGKLRLHDDMPKKWYHKFQIMSFILYPFAYLVMTAETRFGKDWKIFNKLPFKKKAKNIFFHSYWFKQYFLFPVLGILHPLGPINMLKVLVGNILAEMFRSTTFFSLSTVSHHTEGVKILSPDFKPKNKAEYYIQQIETSHNVISDSLARYNLGVLLINQIEHHLFPSAPSPLLDLVQPEIKRICLKYGVKYNESSLWEANKSLGRRLLKYS